MLVARRPGKKTARAATTKTSAATPWSDGRFSSSSVTTVRLYLEVPEAASLVFEIAASGGRSSGSRKQPVSPLATARPTIVQFYEVIALRLDAICVESSDVVGFAAAA